jgi:hypothetical protein
MAREKAPREEPDFYAYVDLTKARLCLDCEVIFEGPVCPACTSQTFVPLTRWIRPTERRAVELAAPEPKLPPPPSKPRGLLKKSLYVGIGAYSVWKMLFEPRKPRRRKLGVPPDRNESS